MQVIPDQTTIQAQKTDVNRIRKEFKGYSVKMYAVPGILLRGWEMLTEQQKKAALWPDKEQG